MFWIDGIGILNCWDKSTRCCNEFAMSLGLFWWWMRRMCSAKGSSLQVLVPGGAIGSSYGIEFGG